MRLREAIEKGMTAMNTEEAKKLSEDALNKLLVELEKGHSDALKAYLTLISRFHKYSWNNCLLIYTQRPDATYVAGFHAWLKLRRHVRKGEKGITILAPIVGRKRTDNELSEDDQTRIFRFRAAHVFDVNQTEGEPLAKFTTVHGDPRHYSELLKSFILQKGIELTYSAAIAPAKGLSSGGRITLLPGLPEAENFSVLVHEVSHELLHKTERRMATTHTIRETEAEAVAFVVSSAIGLDVNTSGSDYIQLHGGDKNTLCESLGFIQKTATEILQALTE